MKKVSFVVMYMIHGEKGCDTEVVMVRQWRSKVDKATLEVPGGQMDEGEDPLTAAIREVKEETGIKMKPKRMNFLGGRNKHPSNDTICYGFSLRLTEDEMEKVRNRARKGEPHGVGKEVTYVDVVKLYSLLMGDEEIEWATMGLVLHAINMDKAFP